jgi:hypothetical protein
MMSITAPSGLPRLMLVELSVVEQRYHAVMEVISGGVPIIGSLSVSM